MPTLLLIRHGENDVMHKRLAGRMPEVHLNEKGRKQAESLVEMLKEMPIKAIYSSPLERAVETAQPLADAIGLPIQTAPGLLEVDYGGWQGRTFKSLRRLKLWKTVQESPADVRFPDGETLVEVQRRVLAQIENLLTEDVVACFSHGDVIRLVMAHFLDMPINSFQRLVISPASISAVQVNKEGRPYVLCLNMMRGFELPKEKEKEESEKAEQDGH